jgi:hypothetical protein
MYQGGMVAKQEADKRAEEQLLGVRPVDLVEAAAPTKVPHGAAAAWAAVRLSWAKGGIAA